jgi:hypothetical protein
MKALSCPAGSVRVIAGLSSVKVPEKSPPGAQVPAVESMANAAEPGRPSGSDEDTAQL